MQNLAYIQIFWRLRQSNSANNCLDGYAAKIVADISENKKDRQVKIDKIVKLIKEHTLKYNAAVFGKKRRIRQTTTKPTICLGHVLLNKPLL